MYNMKKILLVFVLVASSAVVTGQTTVTFKPGPTVGEDAMLFKLDNGCVPNDGSLPSTPELLNFGNSTDLAYFDWTFSAYGCTGGTGRALIRFSGLNTIPSGATITSATLKLYGKNTAEFISLGNSNYPGAPYGTTNEGYIRRVSPGSAYAWNESTVTWISPTLAFSGSPVNIPVSTSQWNWNTSINVTSMVQSIVNDLASTSFGNNGFLLTLQNEAHYRSAVFASSDHSDSTLWPELVVTYTYCNPNFTYCVSSDDPYNVSFDANAPGMFSYDWYIDGNYEGSGATFNYTFAGSGTYEVCMYTNGKPGECQKCVRLCLDENEAGMPAAREVVNDPVSTTSSTKWAPIKGDMVHLRWTNDMEIGPNPTTTGWTAAFNAEQDGEGNLLIYDMKNQIVKREKIRLKSGENQLQITTEGLSSGMYIIKIKAKNITLQAKGILKK